MAWDPKFYKRKTLWKHFGVNKLSIIWKSQLIKLQLKNFNFIKLSRVHLFGCRPRFSSSSFAHASNCLFLSCARLQLFHTVTLSSNQMMKLKNFIKKLFNYAGLFLWMTKLWFKERIHKNTPFWNIRIWCYCW